MAIELFQYHLLKRLYICHCIDLAPLLKISQICVGQLSVCLNPSLEIRQDKSSIFVFPPSICFGSSRPFAFPSSQKNLVDFCKISVVVLIVIALNQLIIWEELISEKCCLFCEHVLDLSVQVFFNFSQCFVVVSVQVLLSNLSLNSIF